MWLYIVRHAQSEGNAKRPGAALDCALTEIGRQQAAAVAQCLTTLGVDHIFASPYLRTLETAEAIRAATGAPAEVLPLLHEHHDRPLPPAWPFQSPDALSRRFPHFVLPPSYREN